MAAKKSTPGTRSRRSPSAPAASAMIPEPLHDHVESAREHLMNAEAVLDCIAAALEDDARIDAPGPYYPRTLRIVRDIVHATIDQLDSVRIKSAMTAYVSAETSRKHEGVKESPPAYLH